MSIQSNQLLPSEKFLGYQRALSGRSNAVAFISDCHNDAEALLRQENVILHQEELLKKINHKTSFFGVQYFSETDTAFKSLVATETLGYSGITLNSAGRKPDTVNSNAAENDHSKFFLAVIRHPAKPDVLVPVCGTLANLSGSGIKPYVLDNHFYEFDLSTDLTKEEARSLGFSDKAFEQTIRLAEDKTDIRAGSAFGSKDVLLPLSLAINESILNGEGLKKSYEILHESRTIFNAANDYQSNVIVSLKPRPADIIPDLSKDAVFAPDGFFNIKTSKVIFPSQDGKLEVYEFSDFAGGRNAPPVFTYDPNGTDYARIELRLQDDDREIFPGAFLAGLSKGLFSKGKGESSVSASSMTVSNLRGEQAAVLSVFLRNGLSSYQVKTNVLGQLGLEENPHKIYLDCIGIDVTKATAEDVKRANESVRISEKRVVTR